MKVLILFREPLCLPTGQSFGLVIEKSSWDSSPNKEAFLEYIRVLAMMYEAGFRTTDGFELELNGEEFITGDLTWGCFAEKVQEEGVQYAIVGEWDGLEESDYRDEQFTNEEKWAQLVGRSDLEWRR